MIYELILKDEAETQLQDSTQYYFSISEELSDRFFESVANTFELIQKNPRMFQIRYQTVRIGHLNGFPFGIHYFIEKNRIYILKILHHRQNY